MEDLRAAGGRGERKGDGGLQGATNAAGKSGERRASGDGTAGREG